MAERSRREPSQATSRAGYRPSGPHRSTETTFRRFGQSYPWKRNPTFPVGKTERTEVPRRRLLHGAMQRSAGNAKAVRNTNDYLFRFKNRKPGMPVRFGLRRQLHTTSISPTNISKGESGSVRLPSERHFA